MLTTQILTCFFVDQTFNCPVKKYKITEFSSIVMQPFGKSNKKKKRKNETRLFQIFEKDGLHESRNKNGKMEMVIMPFLSIYICVVYFKIYCSFIFAFNYCIYSNKISLSYSIAFKKILSENAYFYIIKILSDFCIFFLYGYLG